MGRKIKGIRLKRCPFCLICARLLAICHSLEWNNTLAPTPLEGFALLGVLIKKIFGKNSSTRTNFRFKGTVVGLGSGGCGECKAGENLLEFGFEASPVDRPRDFDKRSLGCLDDVKDLIGRVEG